MSIFCGCGCNEIIFHRYLTESSFVEGLLEPLNSPLSVNPGEFVELKT